MFTIIVALGKYNGELGIGNKLAWEVEGDLDFFKKYTMGKTLVSGRKTYESLPIRPLPGRRFLIATKDHKACEKFVVPFEVELIKDLDDFIDFYKTSSTEYVVIGGASIYTKFLPYADKIIVTWIDDKNEKATVRLHWEEYLDKNFDKLIVGAGYSYDKISGEHKYIETFEYRRKVRFE